MDAEDSFGKDRFASRERLIRTQMIAANAFDCTQNRTQKALPLSYVAASLVVVSGGGRYALGRRADWKLLNA